MKIQNLSKEQLFQLEEMVKCKNDCLYFIEHYVKIPTPGGSELFKLYEPQKDVINTLTCEKDNREIFISYKNDNIQLFRYTINLNTMDESSEISEEELLEDNMEDSKQMFWNVCKLAGMLVAKGVITQEEMNEIMNMEIPEDKDVLDKINKDDSVHN